jgi:hypothetical protein
MKEIIGRIIKELIREMMDHIIDKKIKDIWEAIKQL